MNKTNKPDLADFIKDIIDLEHGVNKNQTIDEIKNKKSMSGANAWMLMCSIVIASIGLNLDSQAVIIGAMLISPLMSPILGIGLSVAINDNETLKESLRHFVAAIIIAIATSTIYFALTPLSEFTQQIEARTEPTFLDIFIAIFGGIAGIISIARKDISTTLPGVAIATALMPPLCVTGYGLAEGDLAIASTSFYLFFLNTFFVSLATYLVIKYMKFPLKNFINEAERKRNIRYIILFSIIMVLPSIYIFSKIYQELQIKNGLKQFVTEYIAEDEKYLDNYELFGSGENTELVLKVYGDFINDSKVPYYQKGLKDLGIKALNDPKITIISTSEVDLDRFKQLESQVTHVGDIASQLEVAKSEKEAQEKFIKQIQQSSISARLDSTAFSQLCNELKVVFPSLTSISLAVGNSSNFETSAQNQLISITEWSPDMTTKTRNREKQKLEEFLKTRLQVKEILLVDD